MNNMKIDKIENKSEVEDVMNKLQTLKQITNEYLPNCTIYDVGKFMFNGKWNFEYQLNKHLYPNRYGDYNDELIIVKEFSNFEELLYFVVVDLIYKENIDLYNDMLNRIPYLIHNELGLSKSSNFDINDKMIKTIPNGFNYKMN